MLNLEIAGLENQLVNEASLSSSWKVHSSWSFKRQSHINILEEASLLRLANSLARVKKPLRVVALVDSFVVRGATSKGRSSSKALSAVLRRVGAVSVAAGLYFTLPYVPTRWNPADDPTRDAELRPSYPGLDLDEWEEEDLYLLSELPKTKRWASLWVRFVLRLLGPQCLHFSDRSQFRQSALLTRCSNHRGGRVLDFDQTLGFPGEGPVSSMSTTMCSPVFSSCVQSHHFLVFRLPYVSRRLDFALDFALVFPSFHLDCCCGAGGALLWRSCFPLAVDFRGVCWAAAGRARHADVSQDCR